ncbi:hypothetical protein CRG98_006176 [Punica granatum]|uniref:Uncharacterized protein n=1 Tax=Punica granatum TaxID=22663 RepID=A0A2I0KZV6_PUNGR|nr:hypothetical protein CRG98_006176 [Punica granatum]
MKRGSGDPAGRDGQWIPEGQRPWQLEENGVGTTIPTTARCKVGLLGLLEDGPRRRRRGVVAAGLGGFSRGLGRLDRGLGSSSGCGFEPWLGGLAWLSCGSHSIRRKVEKSSRLDWLHVCLPRSN